MFPHSLSWQQQLAQAFSRVGDLCRYLQLPEHDGRLLSQWDEFPLRVPVSFAECMQKGDWHDPLLRQVLPVQDELVDFPGFVHDPVGDLAASKQPGVIHKYHGRVLLVTTGSCAVNCRYCFRRNFPYGEMQLAGQYLQSALDYIAADTGLSEVILSGGDPLLLSDDKLKRLLTALAQIPHIKRLRIHSRLPVVLPARISDGLLQVLANMDKPLVLVLHSNHPNELSTAVAEACVRLKQQGVTLLNQSVLLKGVNDDADVLCALSEKLFALGVLPYYLHSLDKAKGVGHFEIAPNSALQLLEAMKLRLPGYLVPKLVQEQAGAPYKIQLG